MFEQNLPRARKKYIPLVRDYLKSYRNKTVYSAEVLSRELDISAVYYRQIEGGQRGRRLPIELVIELIELLKVDALDFLKKEAEYLIAFEELNSIKKRKKIVW
ncbi:MAG: hypothetical protein ABII85_01420 [Bacillota bacterium]